jgi:hypothetical protein
VTDADQVALYGPWARRTPADVARLFEGYAGTWWLAGGWAIEAFTGVAREHDDIDPSVLRDELPLLRAHLADRLHVWAAAAGSLTPLVPELDPEGVADDVLPAGCHQVWTRPSALEPWEYDVLLSAGTGEEWVYRREPVLRMPLADALWERDGVRYLRPELQLLFKAPGLRPKDQADFDATLPHLDRRRRGWLRDALAATTVAHPWMARLTG